jgi:hypothetical protein
LVKGSRPKIYASADETYRVCCPVSQWHEKEKRYWFGFSRKDRDYLSSAKQSFAAFCCGNEKNLFLISYNDFEPLIDSLSKKNDGEGWETHIGERDGVFTMKLKGGREIDLVKYRL